MRSLHQAFWNREKEEKRNRGKERREEKRVLQIPSQLFFFRLRTGFSAVRFLRRSPMLKIPFYVGIVMQKIPF
jgi:hypothetical protein